MSNVSSNTQSMSGPVSIHGPVGPTPVQAPVSLFLYFETHLKIVFLAAIFNPWTVVRKIINVTGLQNRPSPKPSFPMKTDETFPLD